MLTVEIKKIIDAAYDKVKGILLENKSKLETITEVLLEKEKIEGDEFNAAYGGVSFKTYPCQEVGRNLKILL